MNVTAELNQAEQAQADPQRGGMSAAESEELRKTLSALVQLSLSELPVEEQLRLVLRRVFSISWLALQSKGAIFLVDGTPDILELRAQVDLAEPLQNICKRVPFGHCLCGRAAASKKVQFASCVDSCHENSYEGMKPHGHYCVPILLHDRVKGVLNFYVEDAYVRKEKDVEFLSTVAALLAGIIEHRRTEDALQSTLGKLRSALGGAIHIAAALVERRDPYTAGHQQRVANIARAIAREMRLSEQQIDTVGLAGVVHDIGKVAIPADILSYPGKLGEPQMAFIRQHPVVGFETLNVVQFPWPLAQIVRQHHERMDGSGYPDGLRGEQIMLEARILAVADVIEAMSSHRPYRPALGLPKALEEISSKRAILYDPDVVDAALKLYNVPGASFEEPAVETGASKACQLKACESTQGACADRLNCWEFKACGRQPGGQNVAALGICPAAVWDKREDVNGGKHGGRVCWALVGTLCGGKVQGTYAAKIKSCRECAFYQLVCKEEGRELLYALPKQ